MLISSDREMMAMGERIASEISESTVIELIGDVGAGKTTFTKGLALGFGIFDAVSSPSFTISKEYSGEKLNLVHYDFYRIPDPGIMAEDLADAISREKTVVVVEWAGEVDGILPENRKKIKIEYIDEEKRELTIL